MTTVLRGRRQGVPADRRDRRTLTILLFVPAFFLLLYGYALSFDIRNIPLAVQDNDRSSASREVISAFVNSGYFDIVSDRLDRRRDRSRCSIGAPQGRCS